MSTSGDVWWVCCWGHVFRHPPVAEGGEITCPAYDEAAGVCGTSFIFEPFLTEREALEALTDPASDSLHWAPWAR